MSSVLKQCAVSVMAVAVLLLGGCSPSTQPLASSESAAAKEPAGPPAIVTAKTAFWPMYKSAREWSPDVEFVTLTAKEVPGFKNEAGKAAMWEASFGSPAKHQYRLYTYAIATVLPNIHKGGAAGFPLAWGGRSRDAMPIDISNFSVDSDAAYQAAAADAAAWLKKNPTKTLSSFALGSTYKFPAPVWYVMWGDKKSGYVAFVDATSGKVLKSK